MTITEAFNSSNSYGVTYVSLDAGGMSFESESAVHLEDGSLLTLRMPTRQSEKLDIHEVICQRNGWCLAA